MVIYREEHTHCLSNTKMFSPKNMQVSNIMQTKQIEFKNT